MAESVSGTSPTLGDQVSKLYELIAGYHATHLLEIARKLGVWDALTKSLGLTPEELTAQLDTYLFPTDVLCRTAFSFGLLERKDDGLAVALHFDQSLGNPESGFVSPARRGFTWSSVRTTRTTWIASGPGPPSRTRARRNLHVRGVGGAQDASAHLLGLRAAHARARRRARAWRWVLDVGCGGGWAVVQFAERFPKTSCVGIDVEPYSIDLAGRLIIERGLTDRCEVRARSVERLAEHETYGVATSFLVIHEIPPELKTAAFAAVARALKPDGYFLMYEDVYPETDQALRTMPTRSRCTFPGIYMRLCCTRGNRPICTIR